MREWNEEIAARYARKYGECATNRLGIDQLTLDPAWFIVDIGCGTGSALRHAAQTVTEGTLIGVDPYPGMVAFAREKSAGYPIEIRQGAAENLPVAAGVADLVLAFDTFDYWTDKAQGLSEVRRIMRPTGRFAVVKDCAVAEGDKSRHDFVTAVTAAGFVIEVERLVTEEDMAFYFWLCRY